MDSIKFARLYDRDISKSIRQLLEESSYLKSKLFKSLITVDKLDPDVPRTYKRFIADYIKIWEDYADTLSDKIRNAKGTAGVRTVRYDYAKDYIYSKDDYASVLQYTDGVIQGMKSGKFKEPEDIEDFFKFTVEKAFNDKGDSVGAVLDRILINGITVDMISNTSKADAKMFDSIKTYKMFSSSSATELRKAIIKVVDFITDEMADLIRELKHRNTRLYVTMVNTVIEYINYSVACYATRIYLISQYAFPFMDTVAEDLAVRPIDESVGRSTGELEPLVGEFDIAVNIMHGANELICRDYNQCKQYIEILDTFVKAIGADPLFGTNKPKPARFMGRSLLTPDNAFVSKLMGNALFEYLIVDTAWMYDVNIVTEMNHVLKEYTYNNTHAYPGSYTPKQEMLYIIRGAWHDHTLNGYKRLVKDMYIAASVILTQLASTIDGAIRWRDDHVGAPGFNTATINDVAENIKILTDLYTEVAVAFMHKGRDIELHFNNLKNAQVSKIENDLSLKLPYQKLDLDTNINMMNSVPNTTRVPYDILDIYDLPTFESLEMYDDYLRSIPGMENDAYLSEAVGVSNVINFIITRLKSIWDRFMNFMNNESFKRAKAWVTQNGDTVVNFDYTDKTMTILPYKDNISPPKGYDKVITNLAKFDEKVMESEESRKAYLKSLYPEDAIYEWFHGQNTDGGSGAEKYRNLILFYNSPTDVKPGTPQGVQVKGEALKAKVQTWVSNIKDADQLLEQMKSQKSKLDQEIEQLKRKFVNIDNAQVKKESVYIEADQPQQGQQKQEGQGGASMPNVPPTNPKDGGQPVNTNNPAASNNQSTAGNTIIVQIQTAILNIWGTLPQTFVHVYATQYKYLKEAYALGHNNSTPAPQNNQQ